MDSRANRPLPGDWAQLADLLEAEEAHYRRLLRLAWRQNSYMKRQDVDRLEANAADWTRHLGPADAARIARERCCDALHRRVGSAARGVGPLLGHSSGTERTRLETGLAQLRRTAARLARQNELNRHLAAFCIDLAREETRIFQDCVLDDPAGCYGRDARSARRGAGGVIARQA